MGEMKKSITSLLFFLSELLVHKAFHLFKIEYLFSLKAQCVTFEDTYWH